MTTWKNAILFFAWAIVSFFITVFFTGLIASWLPTPAEFFATMICVVFGLFIAARLIHYVNRALLAYGFLLLYFGITAGLSAKKFIHIYNADRLTNVTVHDAAAETGKDYYSFTDSRALWDSAGYYLVEFYGKHHYYAIPVVGAEWVPGDTVYFWAWARTKKQVRTGHLANYFLPDAHDGLTLQEASARRNMKHAIDQAKEAYGYVTTEKPVILSWGEGGDTAFFRKKLIVYFSIFSVLLLAVIVYDLVRSRRQRNEAEASVKSADE